MNPGRCKDVRLESFGHFLAFFDHFLTLAPWKRMMWSRNTISIGQQNRIYVISWSQNPLARNLNPTAITPIVKIMAVLHFVATGSFQYTVADSNGMSQPTFSGVLQEVLATMMNHMNSFIQFPTNADLNHVKGDFYSLGGIPHVVGAIDGTHIALVPPHNREQVYCNRKNFHSINVQVVCLQDLYITSVCALPRINSWFLCATQ